jgi:hypothetical protein
VRRLQNLDSSPDEWEPRVLAPRISRSEMKSRPGERNRLMRIENCSSCCISEGTQRSEERFRQVRYPSHALEAFEFLSCQSGYLFLPVSSHGVRADTGQDTRDESGLLATSGEVTLQQQDHVCSGSGALRHPTPHIPVKFCAKVRRLYFLLPVSQNLQQARTSQSAVSWTRSGISVTTVSLYTATSRQNACV